MTYRTNRLHAFMGILENGFEFGKITFLPIFPFSFVMCSLGYVLQPRTAPSFADTTDWIALFLFFMGILVMSAIHASIVVRMNTIIHRHSLNFDRTIMIGIAKAGWVFTISLFYVIIVALGLLFFIIPGIYLTVMLYFALFTTVLKEFKRKTIWYKKIKEYFSESSQLVQGHWWRAFFILLILCSIFIGLELLCQIVFLEHVVIGNLACVLARAIILPFWYGCIFAFMFDVIKRGH